MKAVFAPRMLAAGLLLALAPSFAQTGPPPVMRWAAGAPNATSDDKNGMKVEGLKSDDLQVFVAISDLKETQYNRVWVEVSNHGKAPIDFNPESAVLLKGDKGIRAEVSDKAAKSIQKYGEAKAQELSSAKCTNMIATQCAPNNSQMQESKQVQSFTAQQSQWLKDNAIKQKTLAPGESEQGYIAFKKDKKGAEYILRIPVGSETFEFPGLSAENKAPSYDNL
jgi:hypothetical protein